MTRPKRTSLGDCVLRNLKVEDAQLCDLYESKSQDKRLKTCCKNCCHFQKIELVAKKSKPKES